MTIGGHGLLDSRHPIHVEVEVAVEEEVVESALSAFILAADDLIPREARPRPLFIGPAGTLARRWRRRRR